MNIPNSITMLRIILAPVFVLLIMDGEYQAGVYVLIAAGASDILDGFIARHFNMITMLGSVLDPLADKIITASAAIVLAWVGLIPWWLAIAVFLRDMVIISGAVVYYLKARKIEMEPTGLGKLNTFVLFLLIILVMGNAVGVVNIPFIIAPLCFFALLVITVSGIQYILVWGRRGAALKKREAGPL
jgi:cardiolipin synthase (CMP-forming)